MKHWQRILHAIANGWKSLSKITVLGEAVRGWPLNICSTLAQFEIMLIADEAHSETGQQNQNHARLPLREVFVSDDSATGA